VFPEIIIILFPVLDLLSLDPQYIILNFRLSHRHALLSGVISGQSSQGGSGYRN
jgi:hypothetical protein